MKIEMHLESPFQKCIKVHLEHQVHNASIQESTEHKKEKKEKHKEFIRDH
jgi:hypothetical protein